MFAYRTYKTVICIGLGTSALYSYQDDIKKKLDSFRSKHFVVKAAQNEKYINLTKPYKREWDSNWDERQDTKSSEKEGPKAIRHILLIRHGQYELDGATDEERVLTKLGQEQAHLTGERLKELNLGIKLIYESTMTRAKETSAIIQLSLPGVAVEESDLLVEGAPIPPVPAHPSWKPPATQFHEDGPRIEAAFRKFLHRADPSQTKDSVEVFVCHANVIRYFVCRALQFPPEGWLRLGLHHASITWLTIRPNGRVSIRCLGDAGHMPPEKLTFN